MAIDAYFKHSPEAMARQLVLHFGRCVWHTSRPTTRLGRQLRALVSAAFKANGQIKYPEHKPMPQWVKNVATRAHLLAKHLRHSQMPLILESDFFNLF